MATRLLFAGLVLGALVLLPSTSPAHGGQYAGGMYRGPGDVVPPSPSGGTGTRGSGPAGPGPGGPSTPGPGGPAAPGPAGPGSGSPTTGGPAGPAGTRGPTTGGRGLQLDDDQTRWELWWEMNKDPHIRLKDAIHSRVAVSGSAEFWLGATRRVEAADHLRPTERDVLEQVLPALKKAIDSTDNRDIGSSCMVAMAKVGRDHPGFRLRDVFLPRLRSRDQELRETAALAFGIAAQADADNVDLLIDLCRDTADGRAACAHAEVDDRTRAFACYGLGLIAHRSDDPALARRVLTTLGELLADERDSSRNLEVAAIHGISLLPCSDGPAGASLRRDALEYLDAYYRRDVGPGEQLLQAHVPTAVARLLGATTTDADAGLAEGFKRRFAADLAEPDRRRSRDLGRSAALALGRLGRACADDTAADAWVCDLLLRTWREHKDAQTRYFSIVALGQIGGAHARTMLLREFDRAGKSLEKPWVALAMGLCAHQRYEADHTAGGAGHVEEEFGRALRDALREVKNPDSLAAFAVALGLCRFQPAAEDLRRLLLTNRMQDELAGHLCIGLALLGDLRSREDIRTVLQGSVRRPLLLQRAAIALGKLGDKSVADDLQHLLAEGDPNLAKLAAIASALGLIGDRRTIAPLRRMLDDESLTELSRAFAAVALGGVGDKEPLPWNSKIAVGTNYRATVETLTDGRGGILDIL
ncbi:MAG: HEAT repeat domain-containing protein [Planctomycetota bacterium]